MSGSSGLYDRARPSYPAEAHAQILSLLAPNSKSRVVELGAGTGLFTRGFVAAAQSAEHSGRVGSVLAVEPSEGMREGFENKLKDVEQGAIDVKIVDGTFERIPVEDASADLVRSSILADLLDSSTDIALSRRSSSRRRVSPMSALI